MNRKAITRKTTGTRRAGGADLASLFGAAAQTLSANQAALNQADTENHNHGDNMLETFNMISQAIAGQKGASPSAQLQSASTYLARNAKSGSGQAYSQGLAQASVQLKGQQAVTPDNAMMLIQALLGGGQQSQQPAGADLLGALMGGAQQPQQSSGADLLGALLGGGQQAQQPAGQAGDLLGSLLGGAQEAPQGGQQQGGMDLGDVLNAGMAFMNAKQQGQGTLQAALSALMAAGPLGQKPHRQESGQLVANALLQAITGMSSGR
jgi:hypothetical protein